MQAPNIDILPVGGGSLPWPRFATPPCYQDASTGVSKRNEKDWSLEWRNPPLLRGYFQGLQILPGAFPMLLDKERNVWMSVTPMEEESQMPHLEYAHGDVLVAGLGLGYYVFNIIQKPEVKSVTIIEKDPVVLGIFEKLSGFQDWNNGDKIVLLEGDIFHPDEIQVFLSKDTVKEHHWDHLYVDIWQRMGQDEMNDDMEAIMSVLDDVGSVSWWTMEIEFLEYCMGEDIVLTDTQQMEEARMDFIDQYAETFSAEVMMAPEILPYMKQLAENLLSY